MELSINTLVVLVLGIFILGGGILLIRNLTDAAGDLYPDVNSQMQRQIENLLATSLVAVPNNVRDTSFNKDEIFAIGFRNKLMDEHIFRVVFADAGIIYKDGTTEATHGIVPFYDTDRMYTLAPNEKFNYVPVKLKVPKGNQQGVYLFAVTVEKQNGALWEQYGNGYQIRLNVR